MPSTAVKAKVPRMWFSPMDVITIDPTGPTSARKEAHVFRGGDWRSRPGATRSASRNGMGTTRRGPWSSSSLGFRIVRGAVRD